MRRSAEQTRGQVLEAAYKLFRRQGYNRVTMDNIAEAAKLTKRTLYHHFNSKDQLLADVLESQHHLALQAFRTFGDGLSGSAETIVQAMFQALPLGQIGQGGPGPDSHVSSSNSQTCRAIRQG